ncbi:hypothetical protein Tco_0980118 [Tanacetum coccineum]
MTTSSGLIPLLVWLPFHGIPTKMSLGTHFQFNADHYVILVAHPAPFWKFLEPFLCLIGMSRNYTLDEDTYPNFLHDDETEMNLSAFIHVADPTKVKVAERERAEGEARLLDSTVGRVVPLLQVALARAESELEASMAKLFGEGGSADQEDSAAGGGQDAGTKLVSGVKIIADETVVAEKPKRPRKKRQVVTDASGSSHPLKKLKGDHRTSSGAAIGGKSPSVLKELLASSMLNVEAGVAVVATLPLVTSSVSATPEHESGTHADSITRLNPYTIGASERYVVVPPVMTKVVVTSYAVITGGTGTKVTTPVHASMFHDSDSTKTVKADAAEFDDHLAPPALFSQIREMDYHHLFTEFNVGTARQAYLNAEVRMWTEYCFSERKRLESECEKQADLLKARDEEIENLKAQLLLKETEAAEVARLRVQVSATEATEKMYADEICLNRRNMALVNERSSLDGKSSQKDSLVDQVHALETTCSDLRDEVSGYERLKEQIKEFHDARINIVNDKVAKLDADLLKMALHLEEKFYPHLITTISGRSLRTPLRLVVHEKGCIEGLSVGHYTEVQNFLLREVDFPLLAELKSHKDENIVDVMNLLRLAGHLTDAPGMSDLQPDVEQLTLPIHRPKDQVVLGETSLSFALSVTHSRVERIRKNVAAQRSALIDVWVPLVDPLSAKSLIGEASTFGNVPVDVVTTIALSTTFAAASSVPPITIEDYEIVCTDGPEDSQGNVASFPTVEFEKDELDTTPERDPPS